MVFSTQWARVRPDQAAKLRQGAWYRVVRLTPVEAVLDVNGRPTAIPRPSLQIIPTPPTRWTIVARPANAGGKLPLTWGARYGVCPGCRQRAHLDARASAMRCPKCNGYFDIGWDDS